MKKFLTSAPIILRNFRLQRFWLADTRHHSVGTRYELRQSEPPVLWAAPLTSFSSLMVSILTRSVVWLLNLHERTSTSIANIHEQIPRLDPFWWTKISHFSPALSMHHSAVCDRIPKWGEMWLIHILHVFWKGFRHASHQCSSKHSSFPRYNVYGEWAQFCWTQMPSVIWVALGYLRNPKGTVTHEIYTCSTRHPSYCEGETRSQLEYSWMSQMVLDKRQQTLIWHTENYD